MKTLFTKPFLYLALGAILLSGAYIAHAAQVAPPAALFDTILSSPEQTADTTMSLKTASTTQGDTLTGFQCFTVDTGTPTVEYECGTMSADNVINLVRNLDFLTGTTTAPTSIPYHRTGADVRQSDFPALTILANILAGIDSINQPIYYNSSVSTSTVAASRSNVASVGLLDDTAFNGAGIINATAAAKGVVQIATGAQAAASTGTGSSGAIVVLPASLATSTWSSSVPVGTIPVLSAIGGKINNNFISTTTLGLANAINIQTFTASSTWTKPQSCITNVDAYLIGGGGGGGSGGDGGSTPQGGGGGSAGGISESIFPIASVPASLFVSVGSGAIGGAGSGGVGNAGAIGSTTSFGGLLSAAGGLGGAGGATSGGGSIGMGLATPGLAYSLGGGGGGGGTSGNGTAGSASSMSPVSVFGGALGISGSPGGIGGSATTTLFVSGGSGGGGGSASAGGAGGLYGGGGGGGGAANGTSGAGGAGATGIAVIACN